MAAVTQLVSNLLGGVSRQSDDKKLDGQVVDIINGYPDPTYGLMKRQGSYFQYNLKKLDGTLFTEAELDGAFWFYAEKKQEVGNNIISAPYLCAINNGQIYVWDSWTGQPQNVTNNGSSYLAGYSSDSFHARTILNSTIICNKNIDTAMDPAATPTEAYVGTIRLNSVNVDETYTVILEVNGVVTRYDYEAVPDADGKTTPATILIGIAGMLPNDINGSTLIKGVYKTSVELLCEEPFTLSVEDSRSNDLMNSYQEECLNINLLANPSRIDRLVKIVGDKATTQDDYFLRYNGIVWEEALEPGTPESFTESTMPHRLFFDSDTGEWIFGPIEWADRLLGNEDNSPTPSFIGNPISCSFYYNNRLGFLSGANVILSVARDPYNFFVTSQLTPTDDDPIDLNANSTRPVFLYEVVTQPQGILLFGTRQQFWLAALESGVLTPTGSSIQAICSYESDKNISPLDMGTTISFVSKTPDYSKLMIMQSQGSEVDPTVVEISKVVTGWLPNSINRMAVSPQNSFVCLTGNDDEYLYIYRFYNDGKEDRMQAWTRWKMPGTIQGVNIANDMLFLVTLQSGVYSVSMISLNALNKSGMQLSDDEFTPGGPHLDFMTRPESMVYDSQTDETKFYVPFPLIPEKQGFMVLTLPGMDPIRPFKSDIDLFENMIQLPRTTDDDPGYYRECTQGTDGTGNYFAVKGDFTSYTNGVAVGYQFDYEVTLPKFYYKNPAKNNAADYSSVLTVNRVRFAVGMTGAVEFKLKALGSSDWETIQHVTDADYYEADTSPVVAEQQFVVPINQRNKHFQLKVTSDVPFPVSLISMMWEGQYSPRFYRRL